MDVSFNNLQSMRNIGNLPKNLSTLLMSNNKLTKVSKEIINFVPNLKVFDVENNLFTNFPASLARIVTKGPLISFKGKIQNCKYTF